MTEQNQNSETGQEFSEFKTTEQTNPSEKPLLTDSEERTLALFAHLGIFLNLFTAVFGLAVPVVIYFAYKDRSKYLANQSLQAIFFQLVFFFGAGILAGLVWLITSLLTVVLIGICLFPVAIIVSLVPVAALVYAVAAAIDCYKGREFNYWLVGDWVKKMHIS